VSADRIPRLERWLKAVDRHEPGESDEAVDEVGSWSIVELRGLWVDVYVLAQLARNPKLAHFVVKTDTQASGVEIRYSSQQLRQLATLACAAGAMLASDLYCLSLKAASSVDEALMTLVTHAAAERSRTGDDNFVMRRAALLHADVAMLHQHAPVEPFATTAAPLIGPQSWRIDIADGRGVDVGLTGVHWDIARLALDQVRLPNSDRPAPERDAMVRAWYRATAAWMQLREDHDTLHLDRARRIFPDDPDLLFLSGCQRETYASPAIQAAARSVVLPSGLSVGVESERAELRQAEGFFRRALAVNPSMGEAHLRLGRVFGLLGRHAEAAAELQQALVLIDDPELQYYGQLFAGAEDEALGRFDAAHAAYQRASAMFPLAQSPLLAISHLARRRGDRSGAAAAIQKVFDLPAAIDRGLEDPWWRYHTAQARNADELLEALREPFRRAQQ
jgi:tetratricopeptide (TPR) repeat protein